MRPLRSKRVLLIVGIVGVVLAALLVGADRFAAARAEGRIEAAVRLEHGARAGETEVEITGFPFLTQALSDRLDRVDATLAGVRSSGSSGRQVRITRIDARFHDVRLDGSWSAGRAARADGEAFISYADLSKAAGTAVTVGYGGTPGTLKVSTTIGVFGRSLSPSVISTVRLLGDGRTVRVHATEVPGAGLPGIEQLVRSKTDFDHRIAGLPEGLRLGKVTTGADGVRATLTGEDVLLGK
ncbi:DUF2993 domain-containing protein [Streptomyces bambusae]|uniref:LmeA family phospholipid-binding protein n=1 Tax=Streptomyces bambusae TaxID=1550616 RepID=UPI001CFE64BF|nr:DUF2993 domain-containing protein [Streptomyces bambusae]MCB5166205.1 DUF2993 domain-containing protein [Streptomyces bambusae]